jgi:hypothetical protein
MTRNRTSVCPNLDAVPRLEIFEERAVPAHIGSINHADVDHGQQQQVAEGWATVETLLHNKPDDQLKSWLNEDSLFVDGPGHSEDAPGQMKKANNIALDNQGTLAALDSTLANFVSYFTTRIEQAKKETQSKSDGPTTPSNDGDQTTQDGQSQQGGQGGQGGSDAPASRPGPVGRSPAGRPPASTTPNNSDADTPRTDPNSASAPTTDDHKVDPSHVTVRSESTNSLIIAPVSGTANMASVTNAANPAQAGELRASDSPPTGQRPVAFVPDLAAPPVVSGTAILDDNVIPAAGAVAADPAVGQAPASGADTAWAPAVAQVNDLVSRFVPLDPDAVEQSVNQFLDHLREARELTLTPRQACLLTAAIFVGLAGGEVARRQRLPQRVSQMLSRSRFFSRTKTV